MKKICKIIFFLLFLLIAANIHAQEEEEPDIEESFLYSETRPESPMVGSIWTITIHADYPNPEEITIIPPLFSPFFTLDRMSQQAGMADDKAITLIEYRLIPNRTGRVNLGPFTVITPDGVFETDAFSADIRPLPAAGPSTVRLAWEGVPARGNTGAAANLTLRVTGASSLETTANLPPEFFIPQAPQDAILSSLPLTQEERSSGIAAKISLIPLKTGTLSLSARTLQQNNINYEIPALRINISGPAGLSAEEESPAETQEPPEIFSAQDFLEAAGSSEINGRQRIFRLGFTYLLVLVVIIAPFICLLVLRKK